MPTIKIYPHPEYCPQGAEITAPAGTSICEALLDNHINIEHAREMSCACTREIRASILNDGSRSSRRTHSSTPLSS